MLSGSKVVDAQAGYEAIANMYPVLLAGTHFVMHAAGWMEAGLAASFAKFVLDAEQIEMLYRFAQGPRFEDFDEAIATARDIGPGGHFLGTPHTQAHFESAFFMPDLLDNNSYEQWLAEDSLDANRRALKMAKQMLASYERPPLDPAIDEALADFVKRREAELPDSMT
jgi:trimethylamine--corrinoid protein Co-methyltransferase